MTRTKTNSTIHFALGATCAVRVRVLAGRAGTPYARTLAPGSIR